MRFFKKINKSKKIQALNKGFTFVEIVIYIGLLSFVLLILSQILTSVLSARLESEATSSVQQDGNYILSRFYHDVTHAESIDLPAAPGDEENTMTLTINGDEITYALTNGKLTLSNASGTYEMNSFDTEISDLNFLRLGAAGSHNTVTISFILESKTIRVGGAQETRNYQTSATTR